MCKSSHRAQDQITLIIKPVSLKSGGLRSRLRHHYRNASLRFIFVMAICFLSAACESGQIEADDVVQWALPDKLREVSGLALTDDERLLAITDEEGIVYEIDYRNGSLVKAFAIGEPTVRADFEGIAVLDGTIWLLTSNGRLYSFGEGSDGERVAYQRINTGLADQCEFEGLTAEPQTGRLLLICKESRKKKKGLRIFEWLVAGGKNQDVTEIELAEEALRKSIDKKQLNPSGISINPVTGNRIVVAARQRVVLELTRDGQLIDVIMRLDAKRHSQPEGIVMTKNGRLLIADEAGGRAARLTIYAPEQRENRE
jgi:uncharacterized protein YjiK